MDVAGWETGTDAAVWSVGSAPEDDARCSIAVGAAILVAVRVTGATFRVCSILEADDECDMPETLRLGPWETAPMALAGAVPWAGAGRIRVIAAPG